jgi:localization factor PodJL
MDIPEADYAHGERFVSPEPAFVSPRMPAGSRRQSEPSDTGRVYKAKARTTAHDHSTSAGRNQKTSLDSAIRQIMDRARTLNEDYSGTNSPALKAVEKDEAVLGILRDEVANLRVLLEQANFSGATEQTLNEIASLSGRIDSMSTLLGQERSDPKVQDALRDIHALLDKPAQDPSIDGHFDRILEKLDTLPLRNHDEEFAQLSSQLDMLRSMLNNAPQAQHFSSLEGQISNLADRLASLESNVRESQQQAPSSIPSSEDLDYRLQSLQGLLEQLNPSDRLMRLEDQLISLADRLEHGSDNVRGPLDALATQVESLTALVGQQGQASQEKTFAALADRVAELDQRLREGHESESRFDHVEQTLARIDDMLARQMETSGLGAIEDRLTHLTHQLDQQASRPAPAPAAFDPRALAGLEAQISGLADRLDAAARDPYDTAHFEALTSRLDSLAEQFDRSQSRFDAVDRIGQDIQRLAQQPKSVPMEGSPVLLEQTEGLAEAAALRALQQVGPLGGSSGDSTLDAILDGLKDDMHGLRQMAQSKEDATQQGLHSVSQALNGIVDRLASLEDQVRKSEQATASQQAPSVQMARQAIQPEAEQEKSAKGGLGRLLGRKKKKQAETTAEVPSAPEMKAADGKPLSAQQLLAQRAAMGRTAPSAASVAPQVEAASAAAQSGPALHGGAQSKRAPSIQLSGKAGNQAMAAAASTAPEIQQGHVEEAAPQQPAAAARPQGAQIIRDDAGPTPQRNASGAVSKADFIAAARRAAQAAARESEQAEADRSVAQSLMDRLKGKRKAKDDTEQSALDLKGNEPKMNRKQRRAAVADAARQAKQSKADHQGEDETLCMMADEAIDPAMATGDARALLEGSQDPKSSLFSKIGQTVSRNSRPLLLAAAAILLAITTLQMAKNPESSLYALFNDTAPKLQAQSEGPATDAAPGVLNGGNLAIEGPENLEPQITLPGSDDTAAPKVGDGSSMTPSSGSLVPDLVGEEADRAIAFSSPSIAPNTPTGPTIEAGKAQQNALGPRRPEVVQDQATALPQPGISGNAGIDLTPTSAINRSELPDIGQQPMPKALTADRSTPAMGTPVSTAIQSAAQMNSLLSPGVSTSPIMTAAEGGDSLAQFELGRRLTLGEGVSVDMKKAAEWFEKAADQSMPQAQYSLANLYEKGHGVKKDLMVARLWYERAAKAGNVKAMHNLAVIHVEGGLGKPDFKQASDWFIKAADHGLKDSQYNLAILFARGMGVKQDLVQSYKWFAIAAHNGDRGAAAKRDEVARVLTGAQLKTAKAIVEAWIPKMSKPSANQVASIPDAWRVTAGAVPGQAGVKLVDPGKPSPEIVRQAQGMLSALGFNTGQPDGKIGPRTRTAIRNFQKSAGFPIDGKLTPALMQALAIRLG